MLCEHRVQGIILSLNSHICPHSSHSRKHRYYNEYIFSYFRFSEDNDITSKSRNCISILSMALPTFFQASDIIHLLSLAILMSLVVGQFQRPLCERDPGFKTNSIRMQCIQRVIRNWMDHIDYFSFSLCMSWASFKFSLILSPVTVSLRLYVIIPFRLLINQFLFKFISSLSITQHLI